MPAKLNFPVNAIINTPKYVINAGGDGSIDFVGKNPSISIQKIENNVSTVPIMHLIHDSKYKFEQVLFAVHTDDTLEFSSKLPSQIVPFDIVDMEQGEGAKYDDLI